MSTKIEIIKALQKAFRIEKLEVFDESSQHASHREAQNSGGGHFAVIIISSDFHGKGLKERHRMIYQALRREMGINIHALAIKAQTPQERQSSKD